MKKLRLRTSTFAEIPTHLPAVLHAVAIAELGSHAEQNSMPEVVQQMREVQKLHTPDDLTLAYIAKLASDVNKALLHGIILTAPDGDLVGFIAWEVQQSKGFIRYVSVMPAYRSRGICGKLIRAAAKANSKLFLLTGLDMVSFYAKYGFRAYGAIEGNYYLCANYLPDREGMYFRPPLNKQMIQEMAQQ